MSEETDRPDLREIARLLEVVRELRARCPWDREQTVASSARHLIEEAYETADAIARASNAEIADELGDILTQALFVAVVAQDESRFKLAEVARGAAQKLIRRHPHIYADVKADTVEQVLSNWDRIKAEEKKDTTGEKSLRETGRALPALMRAEKLGEKARLRGMDWEDARAVLAKVREELEETEAALARGDNAAVAGEIGDMMLALANVPRFIGHNAEETLRRACDKFIARFEAVERLAGSRKLDLKKMSPDEIEALWQEAKRGVRLLG
jgi:tetrapyrrole methylase family protein/MazG family protein